MAPSPSRPGVFGKYLRALSNSFGADADTGRTNEPTGSSRPSAKRKRLHVLYVLNDILFHAKHIAHDASFAAKIEPHLLALFGNAAAFHNAPKHTHKIQDLIDIWEEQEFYSKESTERLRAAVKEPPLGQESQGAVSGRATPGDAAHKPTAKEAPYVMPSIHGDATTPWYDLPAGNWLALLELNSTRPVNPSMIKPLQLATGPADKILVEAVRKLLVDVDRIYSQDASVEGDVVADIDRLGERIDFDEINGEDVGDTYYGWSRAFCEKMKQRRNKARGGAEQNRRGRGASDSNSRSRSGSRGRSSSRESSRPAFKRRRLSSDSGSVSRSRTRSHSRRRSYSRERYRRRPGSQSQSRSRSRSPTPRRSSGPPPPPLLPPNGGAMNPINFNQPNLPIPHPPFPFPPAPALAGFPPPPPNYQGPWPPPPPPIPPQIGAPPAFYPPATQTPFMTGWPVPTPPPPPAATQPGQGPSPAGREWYGGPPGRGDGRVPYGGGRRW